MIERDVRIILYAALWKGLEWKKIRGVETNDWKIRIITESE